MLIFTQSSFYLARLSAADEYFNTRAGLPTTTAFAGTSFVTTQPAPTIAFSPIVILDKIVAPEPIEAPLLTIVISTLQSPSLSSSPPPFVACGYLSLMVTL